MKARIIRDNADGLTCRFCGGALAMDKGIDNIHFFLCDACGAVVSFRGNEGRKDAIKAYKQEGSHEGYINHQS